MDKPTQKELLEHFQKNAPAGHTIEKIARTIAAPHTIIGVKCGKNCNKIHLVDLNLNVHWDDHISEMPENFGYVSGFEGLTDVIEHRHGAFSNNAYRIEDISSEENEISADGMFRYPKWGNP